MILVVVVLALALAYGGLCWYARKEEEQEKKREKEAEVYLTQIEHPASFSYTDREQTFSFTNMDGDWVYDEDTGIPIDSDSVDTMVGTASKLKVVRELDEPDELSDYGLDVPAYEVRIAEEDGTETVIFVGNGAGENYYAMVEGGEKVYTISDELVTGLSFDLASLVKNDTVPDISSGNLKKVTVVQNKETTEYTDEDDIRELAGGFGALSLTNPVDYHANEQTLKDYGLDDEAATVITAVYQDPDTEKEESFTVLAGKAVPSEDDEAVKDSYFKVQGSNLVYQVKNDVIENMMQ